jgi:hypothetical protein
VVIKGHGSSRFLKTVQNWAVIKALFIRQEIGNLTVIILVAMILSLSGGMSVSGMQQTGRLGMDENTVCRLMNNPLVDRKSLLLSFAKQFISCVSQKGESDKKSVKCFVTDDTNIEKSGKRFEGISRIFSHVTHSFHFGYKMLTLCFWDGKSLAPCCLSLHRESRKNEYGLKKKQQKRQFHKERKDAGCFKERYEEPDEEKSRVTVKMLGRAVRNKLLSASYVLMDSRFVSDYILQSIRAIRGGMLHVVGMCKMDKRRFKAGDNEYNSQTVIKMNETKKEKVHLSRKYHSKYIAMEANYHGTPVKLFCIKYKNAKIRTMLLTTDLSPCFVRAMELYQIRWSIEVMYQGM